MPIEAVVEVAVDALGAQYSYDGSWPPPDWSRLSKLSASPHFHPSTLALLCVIWSYLGFPHPLLSLQNGSTYGLSVAASAVNSHAPYTLVFTSLRAAMQEPLIPFRYTVAYFARLLVDGLLFFGLPTAALLYGLSRSSRICAAASSCRSNLKYFRK